MTYSLVRSGVLCDDGTPKEDQDIQQSKGRAIDLSHWVFQNAECSKRLPYRAKARWRIDEEETNEEREKASHRDRGKALAHVGRNISVIAGPLEGTGPGVDQAYKQHWQKQANESCLQ